MASNFDQFPATPPAAASLESPVIAAHSTTSTTQNVHHTLSISAPPEKNQASNILATSPVHQTEFDHALGKISQLSTPNGGVSTHLDVHPEDIQPPQKQALVGGKLPSDDLVFDHSNHSQTPLTSHNLASSPPPSFLNSGVLGVAPPTTQHSAVIDPIRSVPSIESVIKSGVLKALNANVTPSPMGSCDDVLNSAPCTAPSPGAPSGPNPRVGTDPVALDCGCNPPQPPASAPPSTTITVMSAAIEVVVTDVADSVVAGIGWTANQANFTAHYTTEAVIATLYPEQYIQDYQNGTTPLQMLEPNRSSTWIGDTSVQLTGYRTITENKRATEINTWKLKVDHCSQFFENSKKTIEVVSSVVSPGQLAKVGLAKVTTYTGKRATQNAAKLLKKPRTPPKAPKPPQRQAKPKPKPEAQSLKGRIRDCINSFTANTLVRTATGLVAITALSVGTPVLAYDAYTGTNGYYPITAIHQHDDSQITYLTLTDPENDNKQELITTTPEHPFYVQKQVDEQPRPQPKDHTDLGKNWVGAGHLKIGDKVKQADGTTGVVANVTTIQETKEMFNLSVGVANTFYVGRDGWLVHNTDTPNYKVKPTQAGLANIKKHLTNEFFTSSISNEIMIQRIETALKSGRYISDADANFYMHELYEFTIMRGSEYTNKSYKLAHDAALLKYGVSSFAVYHPVAMKEENKKMRQKYGEDSFNKQWFKYWDEYEYWKKECPYP